MRWASIAGHTEIVKLLLEAGANVHAVNDEALVKAFENKYVEIFKFLVDYGADGTKICEHPSHTEMRNYLLKSVKN